MVIIWGTYVVQVLVLRQIKTNGRETNGSIKEITEYSCFDQSGLKFEECVGIGWASKPRINNLVTFFNA